MRYLHLAGLYLRISVLNELQYRSNFWVQLFQSVLSLLVALGGLAIVYGHTESLNGWNSSELLVIVAVYFLIGGVIRTVIQPNMQKLMEDIRLGTLDYIIIKPVEVQFLISVRQVQIWRVMDFFIGVALLLVGVAQIGEPIPLVDALGFLLLLTCGALIVYSFWLMLATITFWFIKIDNILVIFETMYEAGRWPVRIYPGWLEVVLTFLVPVAFAITVPVEALTGRLDSQTILLALALAGALLYLSHRFWRIGIRAYSGASA
ncbi:MAG: ABC transporter permease [Chloroflexota bacterium]